ncbi:MAG: hypothetical protein AAFV29_22190 [Myxococcota bacterium]
MAEKAAQMLAEGTVLLDFCSQCEDRVRVVRVRAAAAVEDCQWQLEVAGRVLWESERRYEAGYDVPTRGLAEMGVATCDGSTSLTPTSRLRRINFDGSAAHWDYRLRSILSRSRSRARSAKRSGRGP